MSVLLQINELTKSYGTRMLFADVTVGVNEGDKIGIIAKNGTGKSTMLRIIAGLESADSGTVVPRRGLTVGLLEQTPQFDPEATVIEACLRRGTEAADAIIAYEEATACGDAEAMARATEMMDAARAWDFEDRVRRMLTRLDIGPEMMGRRIGSLSGGQAKRVALARLLLDEPDLLVLDEPTNHLDVTVIEWLESYLAHARTTLLLVTHDRYFLDRVCNRIIEIDHRRIFSYDTNFEGYLRRRAERIEAMEGELEKVKNTLRRETQWMRSTPPARSGKAKYRIDQYHQLTADRRALQADTRDDNIRLNVKASYIGKKIFEAEHVSKRFGDVVILNDFTYTFARYERLGIIGRNGAGKSTFIKMLQGLEPADSGAWNVGETVRFGYYRQEGIQFDESKRVIDAVTEITEDVVVNGTVHYSPMQFLQHFLFSPADQQKYIHTLSGGERARLHLATVLMRQPNFLILDEPTNDLDIVTLGILEDYLAQFKGCLIVVSHDRFFLDSIVDHLFVIKGGGEIKDFPGTYTEWRASEEAARPRVAAAATVEGKGGEAGREGAAPLRKRPERPAKLTFKERREMEELEREMEALNAEMAELNALFSSGGVVDDIAAKSQRFSQAKERLDEAELRWLELSEKEQ